MGMCSFIQISITHIETNNEINSYKTSAEP